MTRPRNNENYAQIRGALALEPPEVVECLRLAGVAIGSDLPRRWARHQESGTRKFAPMTDAQFDAFCAGLSKMMYLERTVENDTSQEIPNEASP